MQISNKLLWCLENIQNILLETRPITHLESSKILRQITSWDTSLTIDDNYSTAEIVEKQRQSQRKKVSDQVEGGRDLSIIRPASPPDRYTDSEWREMGGEEDKSLEGLLTLARREMEQEKQLKKVNSTLTMIQKGSKKAPIFF